MLKKKNILTLVMVVRKNLFKGLLQWGSGLNVVTGTSGDVELRSRVGAGELLRGNIKVREVLARLTIFPEDRPG